MQQASKEYTALAVSNGFALVRMRKHLVFKHPNGSLVTCPASPSDAKRGLKQFRKHIKQALTAKPYHCIK